MAIKDVRVYFNKGSINNRGLLSKAGLKASNLSSLIVSFFKRKYNVKNGTVFGLKFKTNESYINNILFFLCKGSMTHLNFTCV